MKKIVSFTLDEKLVDKLRQYAKTNSINASGLIEKLIKNYLNKKMTKGERNEK